MKFVSRFKRSKSWRTASTWWLQSQRGVNVGWQSVGGYDHPSGIATAAMHF